MDSFLLPASCFTGLHLTVMLSMARSCSEIFFSHKPGYGKRGRRYFNRILVYGASGNFCTEAFGAGGVVGY